MSNDGSKFKNPFMLWCSCHAQVNSKATVIFTGFIDEEVDENIIWPYVPYLTDEYGGTLIYLYSFLCLDIYSWGRCLF